MTGTCTRGAAIRVVATLAATVLVCAGAHAQDRQFRQFNPIVGPATLSTGAQISAARALTQAVPVPREGLEPQLRELLGKWNTPAMSAALSQQFYDTSRFSDAMNTKVPRDARLTLQAVQGVQTLQQFVEPGAEGGRGTVVSLVSATVRTQVEFNSPTSGYVRRPGTNEFLLEVRQPLPLSLSEVLR